MKKAFTLMELLAVMMIMGLMGTAAVGGYRAMQRGMEERGVVQNVNTMVRAAYQRAQIDRQPTVVFFWNETVRSRTDENHETVVGHAVAVRRHGRLSNVIGSYLVDEFADLNRSYPAAEDASEAGGSEGGIYIYPMNNVRDLTSDNNLKRSVVRSQVYDPNERLIFLSGTPETNVGNATEEDDSTKLPAWAFYLEDAGGVQWNAGMAYGFEFIRLELPAGFIFGSDYSSSTDEPIRPAGTLVFKPGVNSGDGLTRNGTEGRKTVTIYSLRAAGEGLKAHKVADTDSPEERM